MENRPTLRAGSSDHGRIRAHLVTPSQSKPQRTLGIRYGGDARPVALKDQNELVRVFQKLESSMGFKNNMRQVRHRHYRAAFRPIYSGFEAGF
jgi:hypothetical protein